MRQQRARRRGMILAVTVVFLMMSTSALLLLSGTLRMSANTRVWAHGVRATDASAKVALDLVALEVAERLRIETLTERGEVALDPEVEKLLSVVPDALTWEVQVDRPSRTTRLLRVQLQARFQGSEVTTTRLFLRRERPDELALIRMTKGNLTWDTAKICAPEPE